MLDASNVNVDWHHWGDFVLGEDCLVILVVHEAEIVPAWVDESVHGVWLAFGLDVAAFGACAFLELIFKKRIAVVFPFW